MIPIAGKHYQYRMKCLKCSLHYIILSWHKDWLEKHVAICPECHTTEDQHPLRVVELPLEIYEVVPGR